MADISLDKAKYIGILLPDEETAANCGNISGNDLSTFKLLLTILNIGTQANIVAEVESNDTVTKIERFLEGADVALARRVSAFSHNSVIGHISGRTVISPTYSDVFHDILSYDGCEFYGVEPMDVEEALCKYKNCIPVINYDDDRAVDEQGQKTVDRLYIFAETVDSVEEREEPRLLAKPLAYRENIDAEDFVLYIFSDSDRAGFVVEEVEAYNQMHNAHIRYEIHSFREDIHAILDHMNAVEGGKRILLLSSAGENDNCRDTEVFVALLSMRLSGQLDSRIPVFVELINPRNVFPMKKLEVASVIVSGKITSLFMVQLLTHPGSRRFYRDIVVANTADNDGSVDFDIVKAREVLVYEDMRELVFSSAAEFIHSFYQASGKSRMCIGVKAAGEGQIRYLCERTDEEEEVRVGKEDELVVVKYW